MKIITAPEPLFITTPSVFLAGSIEQDKAEKWQERTIRLLGDCPLTILNPRRADWDTSWKEDIQNPNFYEQVNWELDALEKADFILFYFDPNTKSPISLLELGLFAKSGKLMVCCPKGFWKKGNVDIVCERWRIPQFGSLESMLSELEKCALANASQSLSKG